MQQLLDLETRPLGLQHGKAAAATIAGFASKLEFGRVTGAQVTPLVHFLLGSLHMRYFSSSSLWITWKIVLDGLAPLKPSMKPNC